MGREEASQPTAAFVVIGDEILTGKVRDENTFCLAQLLFSRGVALRRVETVPDDVNDIAETIRRLSDQHRYVFTSGGIGPTHDDVTFEAVSRAFGLELEPHQPTLDKMLAFYRARGETDDHLNEARRKMAIFPAGATVQTPSNLWVPVISVRNVWVLPGVPGLFARLLEGIAESFTGKPLSRALVYTMRPEGFVAGPLAELARLHPEVAFGSYPHYGEPDHKVMVSIEGPDEAKVRELVAELKASIDGFERPPDPTKPD